MKAFLMFREQNFSASGPLPENAATLVKDLELETVFAAMADGDPFVLDIVRRAVLSSLETADEILYRQEILSDCLNHAAVVRELYAIAVQALERQKQVWGWSSLRKSPEGMLSWSRQVLEIFFELLKRLRVLAERHAGQFRSEGLARLMTLLVSELDDDFLAEVAHHLDGLALSERMLMSARLGSSNEGVEYVLRQLPVKQKWWERLQVWHAGTLRKEPPSYTYEIPDRDENGARALSELRGRGLARVASALGQATEHLESFFTMLRRELAFYVGCLNLRERLPGRGRGLCLPEPLPEASNALTVRKLYDVSLSLKLGEDLVANDVSADQKALIVVTGANRGGKSTFLRSIGQAQLMMQCGMPVCAESFRANLCSGLFTHYKKEEDASMQSGKLDEELSRMSSIVDHVRPRGLVLCNESFGSTNEREGSEIGRQVVTALLEQGIKVLYVTHMYELAYGFWAKRMRSALFLRAQRLPDGQRTFRIEEGQPLETSYAQDLYHRIFQSKPAAAPAEPVS